MNLDDLIGVFDRGLRTLAGVGGSNNVRRRTRRKAHSPMRNARMPQGSCASTTPERSARRRCTKGRP